MSLYLCNTHTVVADADASKDECNIARTRIENRDDGHVQPCLETPDKLRRRWRESGRRIPVSATNSKLYSLDGAETQVDRRPDPLTAPTHALGDLGRVAQGFWPLRILKCSTSPTGRAFGT